jgi:hypothetical protein
MIKYTLTGAGAGSLLLANAASGNNNVTLTNSNGTHITYWTQGSQNLTTLRIYASSSFAGSLDDIEVWPVADDYSDSDHPLYVVGQLATRNVAPSSGVIAYGSFYISQQYAWLEAPYHSDFDPGTGDFAYLTWFKTNGSSSTAYLLSRQNSSATGARIYLYMTSTGTITGVANDGTAYSVTSNGIYNDGLWHCVIFQKTSAGLQLYIDGTLDNSATGPSLTMTNTTALFRVGISYADASPWFGEIAGVGVYIGTSFTAADAKALYDTEKGLFSYGAPFSVVGNAYLLDVGMLNGGEQGEDVQRKVNQSLSGIHETLFHSRKRNWTMTTQALPYVSDSQTDLMQIKHFIRSVQRGQTFSFNDRIGFDAFEGEYNVILDQASTAMPRVGDTVDYHRITLKLKEQ